jgi:alanine racemase
MAFTDGKDSSRTTRAVVDLGAIEHNISEVRRLVGGSVEILAVVKADAYGHGACEVARACERAGATMLGVALTDEGVELRRAGIGLPILVQCCLCETDRDVVVEHDLTATVASYEDARQLSEKASRAGVTVNVHADIDTGMGRIGFTADTAADEIQKIARLANLNLDGIYTHFSTAEIENDINTLGQLRRFGKLVEDLAARRIRPGRIHSSNSGAVINYPEAHLTLVRPGLMIYGVYPDRKLKPKVNLRPALTFQTAIVFLKSIETGTALGYGRSFVADKTLRIATANVGYADGYPWRLSNKAEAIVRGTRTPIAGRVSMDQLLIDVTSVPDAAIGDIVTLMGRDGSERISAEDVAEWAGTIPYEILCGISKRVPRHYQR